MRIKFESGIFHLSITFQGDPFTANQEGRSARAAPFASGCHGGPLASLIKILAEDQSCAQIHGTSSHGSRNILSRFSRCYR